MAIGMIAIVFGAVTLFSGGSILFGNAAAIATAGNYVEWVVLFNFLAGFFYIAAGFGIIRQWVWSKNLAWMIAIATLLVLLAFAVHIFSGNLYEMRTLGALVLRSTIWVVIAMWLENAFRNAETI